MATEFFFFFLGGGGDELINLPKCNDQLSTTFHNLIINLQTNFLNVISWCVLSLIAHIVYMINILIKCKHISIWFMLYISTKHINL
jgi:hypothetical protein